MLGGVAVIYIGFSSYVITICWITGLLILITDVKAYKHANMKKEQKVSRVLGWTNISIGFGLLAANWIHSLFIW